MDNSIRIVGISSSPRHGNTELMLQEALDAAQAAYPNIVTEMVSFKGKTIQPCYDCKACERRAEEHLIQQCVLKDDWVDLVRPLIEPVPNGVIIASPVYFSNVTSSLRAFMERFTSLMKPYWFPEIPLEAPDFSRTAAGALSVGFHRHGGQEAAILTIQQFCTIIGMVTVGSHCPTNGPIGYFGGAGWEDVIDQASRKGVLDDRWGMYSARVLGRKVARTALLLASAPEVEPVTEPFVSPHEREPVLQAGVTSQHVLASRE